MFNHKLKLPYYIKLDYQVRPQDNLYNHVCNHWMAKNPLPKTDDSWDIWDKIGEDIDRKMFKILDNWLENKQKLTPEQKQAVIYYETLINKNKHQDVNLANLKKS